MNIAPFADRRRRLLARMGTGVAVTAHRHREAAQPRHAVPLPRRQLFPLPDRFHRTGGGAGAAGRHRSRRAILFCRDKDPDKEIWDGYRCGPEGAKESFGFDEAHSIGELDEKLPELIANQPALWHSLGYDADWDGRVAAALNAVRAQSRAGKRAPADPA